MKLLRKVKTGFPENKVFSRLWANLKWQKIKANSGKMKHEKRRQSESPGEERPGEHSALKSPGAGRRVSPRPLCVSTMGITPTDVRPRDVTGDAAHGAPHK